MMAPLSLLIQPSKLSSGNVYMLLLAPKEAKQPVRCSRCLWAQCHHLDTIRIKRDLGTSLGDLSVSEASTDSV
jgi:hypothetical protein